MTHSLKIMAATALIAFSFASTPIHAQVLRDSGSSSAATAGAGVDATSRIQDNVGVGGGATIETMMDREEALSGKSTIDAQIGISSDDIAAETSLRANTGFSDADKNSDGQIDADEFSGALDADTSASSFTQFDTDADGKLSNAEYEAYLEANMNTEASVSE